MRKYFSDKLTQTARNLFRLEESIIDAAQEMNILRLQIGTTSLKEEKDRLKEFTKDAVKYCSVEDIITLKETKYTLGEKSRSILCEDTVEYAYKYEKTVSVEERERLMSAFGYKLKDAKIR
jgi:hypothetical protein